MPTNSEKQQWPQNWKRSVFIPIPKKDNAKEYSNYCTIVLTSHASKVMLKMLQARFQQYVNWELPDVQARFRKGTGIRDQIANIYWIIEKTMELTMLKPLEKDMATNSSILAWRIPQTKELAAAAAAKSAGYNPWGCKESYTTEWLSMHTSCINRSNQQEWN